jgi:hypothetical protein
LGVTTEEVAGVVTGVAGAIVAVAVVGGVGVTTEDVAGVVAGAIVAVAVVGGVGVTTEEVAGVVTGVTGAIVAVAVVGGVGVTTEDVAGVIAGAIVAVAVVGGVDVTTEDVAGVVTGAAGAIVAVAVVGGVGAGAMIAVGVGVPIEDDVAGALGGTSASDPEPDIDIPISPEDRMAADNTDRPDPQRRSKLQDDKPAYDLAVRCLSDTPRRRKPSGRLVDSRQELIVPPQTPDTTIISSSWSPHSLTRTHDRSARVHWLARATSLDDSFRNDPLSD